MVFLYLALAQAEHMSAVIALVGTQVVAALTILSGAFLRRRHIRLATS